MNSASTSIGLYIHIPFCSSKCKYCDFYSETTGYHRIGRVINELILQLRHHHEKLGKPNIETIFIGGGTPSLIPVKELRLLFEAVNELSESPVEWSIESNPESISVEFLQLCREYGVNRLSVGIQSFNNTLLKTLGRDTDYDQIEKGLDLVKRYWTGQLNLDLISSIPGQSRDMVIEDVKNALKYNPDHVSFYSLSVEEGTDLEDEISRGVVTELNEIESEKVWLGGRDVLLDAGFDNYEISNYTKKYPCIHNLNYWELKPYLGIGPGAVSTIIDPDGDIIRITNSKSISDFLGGEEYKWGESKEIVSPKDFLTDYIIMGLRLKKGINKSRFTSIFGCEIDRIVNVTSELIKEGSIENNRTHYKLTISGYDIMNSICVRILDSLDDFKIDNIHWFY